MEIGAGITMIVTVNLKNMPILYIFDHSKDVNINFWTKLTDHHLCIPIYIHF